jgi:CPA2 family monovalent cation:H+ antiporter-2
MLAVLVVQDLAVILMVALLPSLGKLSTEGAGALAAVGWSLLKAVFSVGLALFLALNLVPALLHRIARQGSQELFLLVVVCICLASAYLAQMAGLSLELGAFLAGLVISESDYAHEVFNQVRPLRDVFASLFFVSVGMLLDPTFVAGHWLPITAVVLVILLGKGVLTVAGVYLAGCHGRTAVITGMGLSQIGEFSFVLATLGVSRGLIPDEIANVILASALVTILATPFVFSAAPKLYTALNSRPALSRLLNRPPNPSLPVSAPPLQARVIILGCGRVGRYVSDALRATEVPHVVVDFHGEAIERLHSLGVPSVYGDATSEHVLEQTHPEKAELAVVALPEAAMTEMAVRALKRLAPELSVIARVHRGIDIPRIRAAGAEAVIHAEFEAGMEMIEQGLVRLHFTHSVIDKYLDTLRQERYRGG